MTERDEWIQRCAARFHHTEQAHEPKPVTRRQRANALIWILIGFGVGGWLVGIGYLIGKATS